MKLILLVLLVVLTTGFAVSPGATKYTITRPEGERSFYIYVPASYNPSVAAPLHLSFHGMGDTCENYAKATGFSAMADKYGFLYSYPCATKGPMGTAWNAGTCCLKPTTVDDIGFAKAVVAYAQGIFNVSTSQVFASGFSNGAMLAEVLACSASDVFRAVASVSGVVEMEPGNEKGLEACSTAFSAVGLATAVLAIHGNADFLVPWNGDALLGFPDIPTNFADWATRNQCQGQPVQSLNVSTYSNQVYQSCSSSVQVELVKNQGGGHEWPSDDDFDTTTYITEFFQRFH